MQGIHILAETLVIHLNMNGTNSTEYHGSELSAVAVSIGFLLNTIVLLVGITGNALLMWCFIRFRKLCVPANLFLTVHAGIGILFQAASGSLSLHGYIYGDTVPYSRAVCVVSLALDGVGLTLNVVSTLAVGVYRYFAVVRPYPVTSLKQWSVAVPFCVGIYILVLSLLAIVFIISEYQIPYYTSMEYNQDWCRGQMLHIKSGLEFLIFVSALTFFLALIYALLYRSVRKRIKISVLPDNSNMRGVKKESNADDQPPAQLFEVNGDGAMPRSTSNNTMEMTTFHVPSTETPIPNEDTVATNDSLPGATIDATAAPKQSNGGTGSSDATPTWTTRVEVKPASVKDTADFIRAPLSNGGGGGRDGGGGGSRNKYSVNRPQTQESHPRSIMSTMISSKKRLYSPNTTEPPPNLTTSSSGNTFVVAGAGRNTGGSANPVDSALGGVSDTSPARLFRATPAATAQQQQQQNQQKQQPKQQHFLHIGDADFASDEDDSSDNGDESFNYVESISYTAQSGMEPMEGGDDQMDYRRRRRRKRTIQGKTLPQSIAELAVVKTMLLLLLVTLISQLPGKILVSLTTSSDHVNEWLWVLCVTLHNCLFAFNWIIYGRQSSKVIKAYKATCAKIMTYTLAICRR